MFNRKAQGSSQYERGYHLLRISASQNINSITDSVLHDMAVLDSKSAALLESSTPMSCSTLSVMLLMLWLAEMRSR